MLLPRKRLVTVAATVRRLARMLADVICEMFFPRKGLVAVGAFVR